MLTPQAIEFAMEEGDEELWEVLISLSIHNPSEVHYSGGHYWFACIPILSVFNSIYRVEPGRALLVEYCSILESWHRV